MYDNGHGRETRLDGIEKKFITKRVPGISFANLLDYGFMVALRGLGLS